MENYRKLQVVGKNFNRDNSYRVHMRGETFGLGCVKVQSFTSLRFGQLNPEILNYRFINVNPEGNSVIVIVKLGLKAIFLYIGTA